MTMWDREIRSLLERQGEHGGPYWSRRDGDIHAPAGFSTIDVLGVLGELGARVEDVRERRLTTDGFSRKLFLHFLHFHHPWRFCY